MGKYLLFTVIFILSISFAYAACPVGDVKEWACNNAGKCTYTSVAKTGLCAANITRAVSGSTAATKTISLPVGRYIYSVWIYGSSNSYLYLTGDTVQADYNGYKWLEVYGTGTWTLLKGFFNITSEGSVTISLNNNDPVISAIFDNVRIEKVSSLNVYDPFSALQDYGFVDTTKQYVCYDYNIWNPKTSDKTNNTWLSAVKGVNSYKIIPVNTPFGISDHISNSENWYYCDAMGVDGSGANAVLEYNTFNMKYQRTSIPCYEIFNNIDPFPDPADLSKSYVDCNLNGGAAPCCKNNINLDDPSGISNCRCNFLISGSSVPVNDICAKYLADASFRAKFPQLDPVCSNNKFGSSSSFIEKRFCKDAQICINRTYYDPQKSCAAQTGNRGKPCNDPTKPLCKNGIILKTSGGSEDCCFGEPGTVDCVSVPLDCSAGIIYDPIRQQCDSGHFATASGECCLGKISDTGNSLFSFTAFNQVSNDSFMCFKQDGKSIFSECCYGFGCSNKDFSTGTVSVFDALSIAAGKSRVTSSGVTPNTVLTYDAYDSSSKKIIDWVRLLTVYPAGSDETTDNPIYMTHFATIEFDIMYSSDTTIANVFINGVDYGRLLNYVQNGNASQRWHHTIIPIRSSEKSQKFTKLSFTSTVNTYVALDNVFLNPVSADDADTQVNLQYNSKNYYCTGGFGSWISSLSPDLTLHPFNSLFFTDPDAWMNGYGRYVETCNSYASFTWTGHQCCGYNTRSGNYGEFYNDTDNGCFNGSIVLPGWSVSKSKNIDEKDDKNLFESYNYRGVLYNISNEFIGCQIPSGSETKLLNTTYDGKLSGSNYDSAVGDQFKPLVQKSINRQCVIVDDYYCANGAWREYVTILNSTGDVEMKKFKTNYPVITLKTVPPGPNLVKNGGFN